MYTSNPGIHSRNKNNFGRTTIREFISNLVQKKRQVNSHSESKWIKYLCQRHKYCLSVKQVFSVNIRLKSKYGGHQCFKEVTVVNIVINLKNKQV